MLYVLAYPKFDPPAALQIDRFRSKNEPDRAKLVSPHITLMFGAKHVDRNRFSKLCANICGQISKFSVAFSTSKPVYDPFEKVHKLVLLCDKGGDILVELHNRLNAGSCGFDAGTEISYRPHMTIATNTDHAIIEDLDVADFGLLPLSGLISELNVVELVGGQLSTIETFELGR